MPVGPGAYGRAVPVIIVTDSTAGLPAGLAEGRPLRIVPLHVLMGAEDYREGVDEVPPRPPKSDDYTSAGPSPGELERVYSEALEASGGAGVVAVHLSKALSGTWDAARQAAEKLGPAVRVVDSGGAGMTVGMPVLEALRASEGGAPVDAVYETAVAACARAFGVVYLHRLEDLRRGGRIGGAAAFMSTALSVRVLLRIGGGTLELRDKMRIPSKGLRKLVDHVAAEVDGTGGELAVQHWESPERADTLEQLLRERLGEDISVHRSEFGPVLGLHLGPGAAGVSVLPPADR